MNSWSCCHNDITLIDDLFADLVNDLIDDLFADLVAALYDREHVVKAQKTDVIL